MVVRESGLPRWKTLERLLDLAAFHATNTQRVSPSFFFRSISSDRDDDKFADCAIAANADFIITTKGQISDRHRKLDTISLECVPPTAVFRTIPSLSVQLSETFYFSWIATWQPSLTSVGGRRTLMRLAVHS